MEKNIKIYSDKKPDGRSMVSLYLDANWGTEDDYSEDDYSLFEEAAKKSNIITAYDGENLVGFIRYLSDFTHDTHVVEFIVKNSYKNNGIGTRLLNTLKDSVGNTDIFINTTEHTVDFLKNNGFKKGKLVQMGRASSR